MHTIVFNAPFPCYSVAFNVVFNGVQPTLSMRPSPQSIHHTETMNRCIEMLQCIHCSNYSTHSLLCQDRGSGSTMSGQRQRSGQRQWQRWRELHLFLKLALIPCQSRSNSSLAENSEKLIRFITLGSYCYIQECDCSFHLLMTVHIPSSPNRRGLGVNKYEPLLWGF